MAFRLRPSLGACCADEAGRITRCRAAPPGYDSCRDGCRPRRCLHPHGGGGLVPGKRSRQHIEDYGHRRHDDEGPLRFRAHVARIDPGNRPEQHELHAAEWEQHRLLGIQLPNQCDRFGDDPADSSILANARGHGRASSSARLPRSAVRRLPAASLSEPRFVRHPHHERLPVGPTVHAHALRHPLQPLRPVRIQHR
jgi:hypothetical protein